jgi:hypothetical protein
MGNDDFTDDFSNSTNGSAGEPDLSAFDDDFEKAEASDNDDPPDGKYVVNVDNFEITRTKGGEDKDGKKKPSQPMLKWTCRILGPNCSGRLLWINRVVNEKTLPFLKKDLQTCGMPIKKLSEIAAIREDMKDRKLEVSKKENKKTGFSDIRILKLVGEAEAAAFGVDDFSEF